MQEGRSRVVLGAAIAEELEHLQENDVLWSQHHVDNS